MTLVSMELAFSLGRDQAAVKADINDMFADVIMKQQEKLQKAK
jgi:CarD family transcriptional regulator